MSETKWTREQNLAINEKDSNILVAAAAGSGKTAVLVERIINKVINEKIDINKIYSDDKFIDKEICQFMINKENKQ